MARFYEKIIGCRNEGICRVVTIFGIKFKRKNARVQTLAEIKKLSVQCANLAVSIRTLSEFSKRSHETINALLSKELIEFNSQLAGLSEVSRRGHQATAQKLDEANRLLQSHAEMLADFRKMQEDVNKLQGQNHHEAAQKLDVATNLLNSQTEMLADIGVTQMEVRELQRQHHAEAAQKLAEANNLLQTYVEKLSELRAVQEEANKVQGQSHQATVQKLDETNNLLKTHAGKLAEFRAVQEEANKVQGQSHQATAQKLDEASNLLKTHGEKLAEFRAVQEEANKVQGQSHQATAQKLDEASNLLKSHAEKLIGFRAMQEENNKLQGQNYTDAAQKLDEVTKLVKTDVGRTGSLLELEYDFARYYQNFFEKGFLVPMFEYMDRPDFEEKYLDLIRGMASPSIREINKILSRVRMVKAKPEQARYNFYSVEDQGKRTKLRTNFENRILRVSDNLYAYDKYLLPIRHFEACVFLYKHGIELVRDKESVREKDMIDAGAFIGDSALVLSDYTDKRIFSFEANPENFDLLKKTLEINKLSKVIPIQKALWSSEKELKLNIGGSGSSLYKLQGLKYKDTPPVSVPSVVLDRFVSRRRLKIGLIKVDLEGAELEFLKGAERTIRTQKPVLLLSIYHKPSDFFELKPMLEQWVPEYEFSVFNPVDWGILLETMIVVQPRLPLSQTP